MLLAGVEERGLPGGDGTLLTVCTCDPACTGDNAIELREDCRMAAKVATRFERQERQTTVAGEVGTTKVTGTGAHELVDQAAWSAAEFKDLHG